MLLVDKKDVKLPSNYLKVNNVSPAIDNTIVFLGVGANYQDCLVHVTTDGKLLGQIDFAETIDAFAMLNTHECMVLETRKNNLLVWNLATHQKLNIPFKFKAVEVDKSCIHVFSETRLFCIQEKSRYDSNFFRLTYYVYPLAEDAKPYHVFQTQEAWTFEYNVYKANNHSKLCWIKNNQSEGFELRTYDLSQKEGNKKDHYNKFEHPNHVGKASGMQKCEVSVQNVWQLRPNEFMLICTSNRTQSNGQVVNNNYVWDVKGNTMRQSKFNFGKQYQGSIIDQYNFGNTSIFKTFQYENGNAKETPVFFVNNETEEIIAEQKWQCSYLYKYDFPGYDGNMIVQAQYENANVDHMVVETKKIMSPRQITVHFLNDMIEDPDFDLVYEVVSSIDYQATQ